MSSLLLIVVLMQPAPEDPIENDLDHPAIELRNQNDVADEGLFTRDSVRVYATPDFYFYDEEKIARGLPLSHKIALHFLPRYWDKESTETYLLRLQEKLGIMSIDQKKIDSVSYIILTLSAGTKDSPRDNQSMIDIINMIPEHEKTLLRHRTIEVMPIILIDGRECITSDQIEIETLPSISHELLLQRLRAHDRSFGNFSTYSLYEVRDKPHHFMLTVRKLFWPQNILVLANLISEQPWVKSARPVFLPIGSPISFEFSLTPDQSPTLGERRTITLTVTLYDELYDFDETLVPRFGEGHFVPLPNVEPCFLKTHDPIIVRSEKNGHRVVTISWHFYLYKPGDYTFMPVPLAFHYLENNQRIVSTLAAIPRPLSVGSITTTLHDIRPLVTTSLRGPEMIFDDKQTHVSAFPLWIRTYGAYIGFGCVMCGVTAGAFACLPFMSRHRKSRKLQKEKQNKKNAIRQNLIIKATMLKAGERAYQEVEQALRLYMESWLGIPHNTSADNISAMQHYRHHDILVRVLTELARRHDPKYIPDNSDKKRVANDLMSIALNP